MYKIIYTKYSNERDERFNIRTDIILDNDGKKYIQKTALTEKAKEHIEHIYTCYKLLDHLFKGTNFKINKCEKMDENLRFEFIEGRTLEEDLDDYLLQGDYKRIIETIKVFITDLKKGMDDNDFVITPEFVKVFGEVELPANIKASKFNNIDMIFENVIQNQCWNVIDYEWTFMFPVPLNYIVFRALHYYINGSEKRHHLKKLNLFEMFNITEAEKKQYEIMEHNFQQYVVGNTKPLHMLYDNISEGFIDVKDLVNKYKNNNKLQVFIDYGQGFSEENSYYIKYDRKKYYKEIEIEITEKIKNIRIDPANTSCLVKINELKGLSSSNIFDYKSNGFEIEQNLILYGINDPQIIIPIKDSSIRKIVINLSIFIIDDAIFDILYMSYCSKDNLIESLNIKINEMESKIKEIVELEEQVSKCFQENSELKLQVNKYIQENNDLVEKVSNYLQKNNELMEQISNKNKENEKLKELIADKVKEINVLQEIINTRNDEIRNIFKVQEDLSADIAKKDAEINKLQNTLKSIIDDNERKKQIIERVTNELSRLNNDLYIIQNSSCWKITKPYRVCANFVKGYIKKHHKLRLFGLGLISLKRNGIKETYRIVKNRKKSKIVTRGFYLSNQLTEQELDYQRNYKFKANIKFSIVVPLYNTRNYFLTEMIESVKKQTYSNWELCLGDGSDNQHKYVKEICHEYAKKDPRIKYRKIKTNKGIAGNTIEAFKMSDGDYIVLLDHDDILTEDALFELACCIEKNQDADFIYSDRGIFSDETKEILAYHFLPGFSPDFLRACNYASHLNAFSRYIINKVGFIRMGYDGSQDYDFELRVMEKARKIVNIPKVLYYCRACEGSVALNPESKMYAYEAGRRAIEEHIKRIGYPGEVEFIQNTFSYRIKYEIKDKKKVCIIIPNKDHAEDLRRCIDSILDKTDYENYEILIVENNSTEEGTFEYYDHLKTNPKIRVIEYKTKEFNYSAINNYGVKNTDSPYLLFLNNDTQVINSNWLREMVMFVQREDVGAVGAKLYYPDDTYQHVGLFIGLGGHIASHYDHRKSNKETGYMHRLSMPQNYNAVTAACLMVKREDFMKVNGFDEVNFKVGLNDIDLCLKLREIGKINVLTPYAELYHYESLSRGSDEVGEAKKRYERECEAFRRKWKKYYECYDEYLNPNFKY